jgi:hypothetical protein
VDREAVTVFARSAGIDIVATFHDAAVSGADPIDARPGFMRVLEHCAENAVGAVLVENASRFARDLAVQLAGHQLLRARGIELVPVETRPTISQTHRRLPNSFDGFSVPSANLKRPGSSPSFVMLVTACGRNGDAARGARRCR